MVKSEKFKIAETPHLPIPCVKRQDQRNSISVFISACTTFSYKLFKNIHRDAIDEIRFSQPQVTSKGHWNTSKVLVVCIPTCYPNYFMHKLQWALFETWNTWPIRIENKTNMCMHIGARLKNQVEQVTSRFLTEGHKY